MEVHHTFRDVSTSTMWFKLIAFLIVIGVSTTVLINSMQYSSITHYVGTSILIHPMGTFKKI
jgi:hypothetical protein